jgi:hypothetical protein
MDGPSRSSSSAPRASSSRSSRTHPSPAVSFSTVISFRAWSPGRGIISLRTAGVPSERTASATNASVEVSYGRPTVIDQSCSRPAGTSGVTGLG